MFDHLSRALPLALLCSCSLLPKDLPSEVALRDMEQPLALFEEPQDEAARQELAAGCFSGLVLVDARGSLEAMLGAAQGLLVDSIIENSPAQAARLEAGDLLLEADAGQGLVALGWPSEWRAIELAAAPGTQVQLIVDRAGAELELSLELVARLAPAARVEAERFAEEEHVGVVLRTATEVEARAAGLAPGAGAVVVGLARSSPWRVAGLKFEDLLSSVDGEPIAHPRLLLDRIRAADAGARLKLEVHRGEEVFEVEAKVSRRASRMREFSIPLLLSYENDGDERSFSLVFGLFGWTSTEAAWRMRLLWLISFGGGDSDRLVEVAR